MKRLLGLTGITYLSVLTVVFYFQSNVVFCLIGAAAAAVTLSAIFFKAVKLDCDFINAHKNSALAAGASALCACIAFAVFVNSYYEPLINKYNNKIVDVQGYICEEVLKEDSSFTYEVKTDKVDGEAVSLKLRVTSYADFGVSEFDNVSCSLSLKKPSYQNLAAKGIYFTSCDEENTMIKVEKDSRFDLYSYAVSARLQIKSALDSLLSPSHASLCKAVLLGDKNALSDEQYNAFTLTGTTFMIVVSGMHLSIIISCLMFLFKRIIKNRLLMFALIVFVTVFFIAVTGCNKSVIRSGVTVLISYSGRVVFRQADALNSLGCAALALTLFNPIAVADIGMLLSFAATAGIIVWSDKISSRLCKLLRIKNRLLKSVVSMFSVSLSASLWVIPITISAFGKISPLVPFTSIFLEPFVAVILAFSLVASVLFLLPLISFAAYPFAIVCGLACKIFSEIIMFFSDLPYICVNADKPYFYVWLAITLILTLVGCVIKARLGYVCGVCLLSASVLMTGWGIFTVIDSGKSYITVYSVGYGTTVSVSNGKYHSVISCGGQLGYSYNVTDSLSSDCGCIDNLLIPDAISKYDNLSEALLSEFYVSNVFVYSQDKTAEEYKNDYDGANRRLISKNTSFSLELSPNITDTVVNIDGDTVQYISGSDKTVLFICGKPDVEKIPERLRSADYVILSLLPENYELLDCDAVIFSGSESVFKNNVNSFKEISSDVFTTLDGDIEISV